MKDTDRSKPRSVARNIGRSWCVTAVVLAAFVCGCAPTEMRGHLVIAGGGTSADNTLIYGRFVRPLAPGARIGIIPTASANTAAALESAARTVSRHAGSRPVEKIAMSVDNPGSASDERIVAQIRSCKALWFTGGVQSRIVTLFRPETGDTPAYDAVREVLSRGGVVGGTSAGAAMMSDPMIVGGTSEQALLGNTRGNGDDEGFGIGKGMGLFPFGLTDQHFLRRGRIGRLVVALELAGLPRGYGVEEDSAIDVDLASGEITCLGSAVVVDVSGMVVKDGVRSAIRVSLLQTGDVIDGRSGAIRAQAPALSGWPDDPTELPTAWSATGVIAPMRRLVTVPSPPVELRSESFVVRYRTVESTRFHGSPQALTVIDVEMEILPIAAAKSGRAD